MKKKHQKTVFTCKALVSYYIVSAMITPNLILVKPANYNHLRNVSKVEIYFKLVGGGGGHFQLKDILQRVTSYPKEKNLYLLGTHFMPDILGITVEHTMYASVYI